MDDQQFRQLLQYLGLSWRGYRKVRKGVKRRIRRHMHLLGCRKVEDYLLELGKFDEARRQCERLMTVPISRFFRDKRLWEVLQGEILPGLIERHRERVRVWSAGCASGEEVYSIKILWDNLGESMAHMPDLEITATDMNPMYLKRARAGVYALSSLKEAPEKFKSVYFQRHADSKRYAVNSELKRGIIWKTHHLLSDPPGSRFDLIFLRNNLLTYYQDEAKKSVFKQVMSCLNTGGFLFVGSHESLPYEEPALLPLGSLSYAFMRQE